MMSKKSVQSLLLKAQEKDVPRAHPLNRIQVHGNWGQGVITIKTATGERGSGGEVISQRKVQQSFLKASLTRLPPPPPTPNLNKKFQDLPLNLSTEITELVS